MKNHGFFVFVKRLNLCYTKGMETVSLVLLIIAAVLIFAVVMYFIVGEFMLRLSVKRRSIIGMIIRREINKNLEGYMIDFSYWDNYELEEVCVKTFDGLKLYPHIIENKKNSKKVAILVHGYYARYLEMNVYADIFLKQGYNIVLTQNRAHGRSEGKFIGMGWFDRLDVLATIKMAIKRFGKDCEIDVFGISMGGATVCMLSGEELPHNVKHIIADCAYANCAEQFGFVLNAYFRLPSRRLLDSFNSYCRFRCGYYTSEVDAIKQIKNCKVPILLIHGDQDTFVPFSNLQKLYDNAPKELRHKAVFQGAGHGASYASDPERYREIVKQFLKS